MITVEDGTELHVGVTGEGPDVLVLTVKAQQAEDARDTSGGLIEAVTDEQILAAHRILSSRVGVFVEPASAAGVAGILMLAEQGRAGCAEFTPW